MDKISEIIKKLILNYSLSVLSQIANKFDKFQLDNFNISKNNILSSIHDSDFRKDLEILFQTIKDNNISPKEISLAIKTSILVKEHENSYETIQTIWTGPDSNIIPLRRTDMALIELINSAKNNLLIVTYAVYKVDKLLKAIEESLNKGVKIQFVFEDHKKNNNESINDIIERFGDVIKRKAEFFVWDKEKRTKDYSNNTTGILHVKCAVADNNMLFLSSANLTDSAMNLNMELGVLITGGEQPQNISKHFKELIKNNILVLSK